MHSRGGEELGRIRVHSIGGGDIVIEGREQEMESEEIYMENSFAEILQFCQYRYVDLVEYIEMNEGPEIWDYLMGVWRVMAASVEEGLSRTGELPGGLHIQRKAKYMHDHIVETKHPELVECQKVCSYAYAVSEQNADNGTIVTAPTCGSCGVLPAVLYYFRDKRKLSDMDIAHALGVAGLFGELAKRNASVSGAECGCQAEVGVACSMAAAAACQAFGYNIHQIEYAAEVSLEHHLGLTCDPICGLVQVPCIERNAVAAMRAINSANIAYFLTGTRNISYDMVLKSMYYTGLDMNQRYRETAEGGLARILYAPGEIKTSGEKSSIFLPKGSQSAASRLRGIFPHAHVAVKNDLNFSRLRTRALRDLLTNNAQAAGFPAACKSHKDCQPFLDAEREKE